MEQQVIFCVTCQVIRDPLLMRPLHDCIYINGINFIHLIFGLTGVIYPFLIQQKRWLTQVPFRPGFLLERLKIWCSPTDSLSELVLSGTYGLKKAVLVWYTLNVSSEVGSESIDQCADIIHWI